MPEICIDKTLVSNACVVDGSRFAGINLLESPPSTRIPALNERKLGSIFFLQDFGFQIMISIFSCWLLLLLLLVIVVVVTVVVTVVVIGFFSVNGVTVVVVIVVAYISSSYPITIVITIIFYCFEK